MIFWFNFYFCIATEVSTNKKTSVLYDSLFFKVLNFYQYWYMESHVLTLSQTFKRPIHAEKTVLSTSLLWVGSNLQNLWIVQATGFSERCAYSTRAEASCTDILVISRDRDGQNWMSNTILSS